MTTAARRHAEATSELNQSVAAEVRAVLARQRISGAELSRMLGRSQSFMARRLDGRQALDLDDLAQISAVLGIPVASLFVMNGENGRMESWKRAVEIGERTRNGSVMNHGSSAGNPHGNVVDLARHRHASGPIDQVDAA